MGSRRAHSSRPEHMLCMYSMFPIPSPVQSCVAKVLDHQCLSEQPSQQTKVQIGPQIAASFCRMSSPAITLLLWGPSHPPSARYDTQPLDLSSAHKIQLHLHTNIKSNPKKPASSKDVP